MSEIIIAIVIILAAGARGHAAPIYTANGKEIPAASASLEALAGKTVMKCEHVVLKANDKGKLDLKPKDTNGNWQPVTK